MTDGRTLIKTLWLPFESIKTLYEGTSEVRLYRNDITGVNQIGKRVSAIGDIDKATVFREPTLLQSISHDHIVPVHDVAIVGDASSDKLHTIIEMIIPFYEKGSVYDALERGERFSVGEAVKLTREGLCGLSELHEGHHLLHRDIKSGNVFIDGQGRLRVGDLGLAVPMDEDGSAEAFQNASQMYTAPETLIAKRIDRRTDIYGFGLILFELLNGPLPYGIYTRDAIWERLKDGKRPIKDAHVKYGPHIPPRLRSVLNKSLARSPESRFPTARNMMDALDRAPFVDWQWPQGDETEQVWEGPVAGNSSERYRAVATKYVRKNEWRIRAEKYRTRWQRCGIDDQTLPSLSGSEATAFFDQVVKHAIST